MLKGFREFISRGNILDLAVGIAVGTAFSGVVKSLVNDIIMPPVGLLLGQVDFADKFVVLKQGAEQAGPYTTLEAATTAGAVTWRYGQFINSIVNLLLLAMAMYLLLQAVQRLMDAGKEEEPAPAPMVKTCPYCRLQVDIEASRCPHCTSQLEG